MRKKRILSQIQYLLTFELFKQILKNQTVLESVQIIGQQAVFFFNT